MTKTRDDIATYAPAAAPGAPAAWRIETAPVAYEKALAVMEARAAAIAAGEAMTSWSGLSSILTRSTRLGTSAPDPSTLSSRGFPCLPPAAAASSPITCAGQRVALCDA